MISYETSHPVTFRADEPFESLVVRVPRKLLGRDAERISKLTALRIPGGEGLPRAAVAFFRGLVGGLEDGTLAADDSPNTVECVLDLVRGVYAVPRRSHEPARLRSRAEILLDIQSFIEANLGDPDLDPEEIARSSFISTRYLHKLFEARGDERVPVDPRGTSGAVPPRSARPGAPPSHDPRDRDAAGACPARSTSAACSARRTLLAERASARRRA